MDGNELIQEEVIELIAPEIIRPEVNFLLLPFFALSWKEVKKITKIEYQTSIKRGGAEINLSWTVLPSIEYGIPTPFDKEVKGVVDAIISQTKKPISNPLELPYIAEMARTMGLKPGKNGKYPGWVYRKIKESFRRMTLTGVESKGTFYAKGKRMWIDDTFHLYERVIFRGEEMPDGTVAEKNHLWLSSLYLDSINDNYVKPIDYTYFQSLNNHIAKRLYEFLGVKFYGLRNRREKLFRIGYLNLCQLLPITPQKSFSLMKKNLDPPHDELIKTGFLAKVEYDITKDGKSFNVLYFPGERAIREMQGDFLIEAPELEEGLPYNEVKGQPKTIEAKSSTTYREESFKNLQPHPQSYGFDTLRTQPKPQPKDSEFKTSELRSAELDSEVPISGRLTAELQGPSRGTRETKQTEQDYEEGMSPLAKELFERGITKAVAIDFAYSFPEEYLREKIELADYKKSLGELTTNAAGWLREAILRDYKLTQQQLKKQAQLEKKKAHQEEQRKLKELAKEIQEQRLKEALTNFPSEEQWVRERVMERINMRELTIKAVGGERFSPEEIEAMYLNFSSEIPKTEEEKRKWLVSNYSKYALSAIISELRQKLKLCHKEEKDGFSPQLEHPDEDGATQPKPQPKEQVLLNSVEDVLLEVARQKAEFEEKKKTEPLHA